MSKLTNYSSPFQSLHNKSDTYRLTFPANSRWTKQSFKDECDINTIMGRYLATGEMPDISGLPPQFLDVSSGYDFQVMQNQIIEARTLFEALPAGVRSRFANNPAEFLSFVADPANASELVSMGLTKSPPAASIPQRSEDSEGAGKQSAPVSEKGG